MFLRSSVVKKGGKTYRYWKLVENVRTSTGPRQQVVAHLGDLSNFNAADWQALAGRMGEPEMAASLERRVRQGGRQGRPPKWTIQDRSTSTSDAADLVSIRLSETSWREPVAFGDVYTALVLWKRLGLAELLGERMNGATAKVPWPVVAALIAVNRLVEPMAEWPMVRWWQRTALPQLLGIPLAVINDDRLYRCLDLVLPHKQAIEERIAGAGQSLFGQSYRYLLYDLTSTYFEGQMESNPKAVRGYSRDHRPDCKQVTIGAVVDREGYPVGYEVLAGNVRDHKTVAGMLQRLGARFGLADRTLCMDRGMVTQDSLKLIRESTVRYVLADRRGASERFPEQIQQGPWQTKRADPDTGEAMVEVQEVGEEEGDRLILVRSRGCAQKEKGIHDRMLSKLKAHLERLESAVRKGRLVEPEKIDRRIGSILARHPGMSSWVCVRREELSVAAGETASGNQKRAARPRQMVHWHVLQETQELVRQLEGVYLLRTNVAGTDAGQVWEDYVTLVRVENAFRTLKQDLALRPVCHHLEERAEAHVLFCWIAYAMYWALERTHRQRGGSLSGRRVLEVLRGIQMGTICLRKADGMKLELERVSTPRSEEALVLQSLHVALPRPRVRLGRLDLTLPEDLGLFGPDNDCSDKK
jgi:transposase